MHQYKKNNTLPIIMKWLVGILLTFLVAFVYGQASSLYIFGQLSNVVVAIGNGLLPALIAGMLGPYFFINDPKVKAIIIGIIIEAILLGIYWLVTSGILVSGPLI